jgi:signal transduction histidine kinase
LSDVRSKISRLLFGGKLEQRLVKWVLVCGAAALLLYAVLSMFFVNIVETSELKSSFVQSRLVSDADSLQKYVDEQTGLVNDVKAINDWDKSNGNVLLAVSVDGRVIYPTSLTASSADDVNTIYTLDENDDETEDQEEYDDFYRTELTLSDGEKANIYIYADYDHVFFILLNNSAIAIAVVGFFVLFVLGIHRRISYIRELEADVVAMGSGDLDQAVTVVGDDELGSLAHEMDEMRVSFAEQMATEQRATQANRDLVTTMSHDLRTPLTSLLLYVQILKDGRFSGEQQMQGYLDKIYDRSMQIKSLSDSLFRHFLVGDNVKEEQEHEEGPLGTVMEDLLSGFVASLEAAGFTADVAGTLNGEGFPVDVEKLSRVIDNLLSNALKYADAATPIQITAVKGDTQCMITISNAIARTPRSSESTGIGIGNIKRLMGELGGMFSYQESNSTYTTRLKFPRRA